MIRTTLCAAVVAVLPHAGFAQDRNYDPAATQSCLQEVEDDNSKRDCIGTSAEQCADASIGGFNTRTMTACLWFELELFDGMLNAEYAKVRDLARETDKFENGINGDEISMVDRLVQMQRAWITYRDATCAYEKRQYGGGTIGQLVHVDCLATLTAEQAFRLQSTVLGL